MSPSSDSWCLRDPQLREEFADAGINLRDANREKDVVVKPWGSWKKQWVPTVWKLSLFFFQNYMMDKILTEDNQN